MRVLSYNIRHGVGMDTKLDLQRIADTIAATGAGLIGLQEVDRHFSERSQFKDQIKYLAEALRMHYIYFPTIDREPLTDDEQRRQYGLAALSQYPVLSNETWLLPSEREQRGLLQVTIEVADRPVHLFNTHLGLSSDERIAQIDQIKKYVAAQPSGDSIILGDFNAHSDSQEIASMCEQFQEVLSDQEQSSVLTFPSDQPKTRLDYIFYTDGLKRKEAEVIQTLASDHLPVLAHFKLV